MPKYKVEAKTENENFEFRFSDPKEWFDTEEVFELVTEELYNCGYDGDEVEAETQAITYKVTIEGEI